MAIPITSNPPSISNKEKELPPLGMVPQVCNRNEVDLTLLPSPISRGTGPTRWTYRPERPTEENLPNWLKWCGTDLIISATFSKVQLAIQDIFFWATHTETTFKNEKGEDEYESKDFDEKEFLVGISSLSTRGEKLSDLEERQQELVDSIIKFGDAMELHVIGSSEYLKCAAGLTETKNQMKSIKGAIERKQRTRKSRAEVAD